MKYSSSFTVSFSKKLQQNGIVVCLVIRTLLSFCNHLEGRHDKRNCLAFIKGEITGMELGIPCHTISRNTRVIYCTVQLLCWRLELLVNH